MNERLIINDLEVARALHQAAKKFGPRERGKWVKIADELNRKFGTDRKPTTWRALWVRLQVRYGMKTSPYYNYMDRRDPGELTGDAPRPTERGQGEAKSKILIPNPEGKIISIREDVMGPGLTKVLELLDQKQTLPSLAEKMQVPANVVLAYIDALKEVGAQVVSVDGVYWNEKRPLTKENVFKGNWNGERVVRFGVVTDTHMGSHFQQLTHLETFYDHCERRGIDTVYHGGDLSDGWYPSRPEHIFELHAIGLEAQARHVIERYPKRTGITTFFIEGNHDATHMKNGGGTIGRRVEVERPDMKYLGYGKVKVWLTPKCDMDVIHPNGGKSYALSYKLQKSIDALQGGNKPRILLMGHFHSFCYVFHRNVHGFMLPGFQAQNTWATLGFLQFQVGGIVFEVTVNDEGEITALQPTLFPFYVMKERDF